MIKSVLITGGAGFIGSHVADELLEKGYRVRALDNLSPQVHGPDEKRPDYLHPDVELMVGDVRDQETVRRALQGVDAVFHFAAMVGVGQSMYEIERYTSTNNIGTAALLEAIIEKKTVQKLIVASSMSIYGEGLYNDQGGQEHHLAERSLEQLREGFWELRGAKGEALRPVPTPEGKIPSLASVYALSKYDQERMALIIGRAYHIPTVALRFFNVYGTRQALSNPYTGVLAIFASRLLNGRPPLIFEDGNQRRDFVNVHDVAKACRLALEFPLAGTEVFNVGSGVSSSVNDVAEKLAHVMGRYHLQPEINGSYRVGDIRHCFADINKARQLLGYEPQVTLEDGLARLANWLEGQLAWDHLPMAHAELSQRGLSL